MKRLALIITALIISLGFTHAKTKQLRIMSYNIRIGIGMDGETNLKRIADVINRVNPYYVGLQEVDSVCERSFWVSQYTELAKQTGMYPIFAPATPRSKGLYGIAALCKDKPISYKNIPLPGKEEPRALLCLEFKDYILFNTHFSLDKDSRLESIKIINEIAGRYGKPIIITGDFNMTPESDEFKAMDREWQLLSAPLIKTYPSDKPRLRLDYIYGDKSSNFNVKKDVVIDVMSSDHLPLYIDLEIKQ